MVTIFTHGKKNWFETGFIFAGTGADPIKLFFLFFRFLLLSYLHFIINEFSLYVRNMQAQQQKAEKFFVRPYSHETFLHKILRYCDKKILR